MTVHTLEPRAEFGAFMKRMRERAGLTQGQLAAQLGYTCGQFVSNWERGHTMPPIGKLPRIARALGTSHRAVEKAWTRYIARELNVARVQLRRAFREARAG